MLYQPSREPNPEIHPYLKASETAILQWQAAFRIGQQLKAQGFVPDVILFPADMAVRHQKLLQWVQALDTGTSNVVKETSLHGDFLKDVFQDAWGCPSVIGGAGYQGWQGAADD